DAYVTATIRCAPPLNKPLPDEVTRCEPYLLEELRLLDRVRVVVGLGRIGWQAYLRSRRRPGLPRPPRTPTFGHGEATRFEARRRGRRGAAPTRDAAAVGAAARRGVALHGAAAGPWRWRIVPPAATARRPSPSSRAPRGAERRARADRHRGRPPLPLRAARC